jgi:hypothetical protein
LLVCTKRFIKGKYEVRPLVDSISVGYTFTLLWFQHGVSTGGVLTNLGITLPSARKTRVADP